jgi:hypothetical protein
MKLVYQLLDLSKGKICSGSDPAVMAVELMWQACRISEPQAILQIWNIYLT